MLALGHQTLVELYGCDQEFISHVKDVEDAMNEAASKAGANIVTSTFHQFSPHGVSGVVVIEESHFAIHTWPEYGYAAADFFTCGESADPIVAAEVLKQCFNASEISVSELKRGSKSLLKRYSKPKVIQDLA